MDSPAGWSWCLLGLNNAVLGADYGYVSNKPSREATVLDVLGPWPLYLVAEMAIVMAGWALITLPWTRRIPRECGSSRTTVRTTRSKAVVVNRTRTSISSPTAGDPRAVWQEQHRRQGVEEARRTAGKLAVDGERRPHDPDGVEAAPGQRGGLGPDRVVAGGCLEPDAVGGASGDHQDVGRPSAHVRPR